MFYTKSLKFDEKPDYDYYRSGFEAIYKKNKFEEDDIYDWMMKPYVDKKIIEKNEEAVVKKEEKPKSIRKNDLSKSNNISNIKLANVTTTMSLDTNLKKPENKTIVNDNVPNETNSEAIPIEKPLPMFILIPTSIVNHNIYHRRKYHTHFLKHSFSLANRYKTQIMSSKEPSNVSAFTSLFREKWTLLTGN